MNLLIRSAKISSIAYITIVGLNILMNVTSKTQLAEKIGLILKTKFKTLSIQSNQKEILKLSPIKIKTPVSTLKLSIYVFKILYMKINLRTKFLKTTIKKLKLLF